METLNYEIMNRENLLRIYELIVKDEQFIADLHQKRIHFFTTIITTILGVTIAGVIKSEEWTDYLVLIFGPILIIIISEIAQKATKRIYRLNMELISSRAKIEQELGLTTNLNINKDKEFWNNESIIPTRYLESRKKFKTSEDFLDNMKDIGLAKLIRYLFRSFQFLGILLMLILILETISNYS